MNFKPGDLAQYHANLTCLDDFKKIMSTSVQNCKEDMREDDKSVPIREIQNQIVEIQEIDITSGNHSIATVYIPALKYYTRVSTIELIKI